MNKKLFVLSLPLLLTSMVSCGNQSGGGKLKPEDIVIDEHYYENITQRVGFDNDNEENFVDDITDGLNDSVWDTLDGFWEAGGTSNWHNGVRRRNLYYSKDSTGNGYLVMRARGKYNDDPDLNGKAEGACINTKNNLGPGRYEVEMAAMPKEGGCTALWTYGCPKGSEAISQNEIDIEIGGGSQFTNLWCTTWTTHTNKATSAPDVSDICYMNDGKIHKYTFDWYTDFLGSGEPRIDWFIDGIHVQTIDKTAIPDTESQLWLGVWLPSWAGSSKFEDEYLIIDKVSYTAFDDSQYFEETRAKTTYSPRDPSQSGIQNINYDSITKNHNVLSNGDFEKGTEFAENDYYGWQKHPNYNGTMEQSTEHTTGSESFKISAVNGGTEKRDRAYFYQELTCMYKGFSFDFSIDAKLEDNNSQAKVWIYCADNAGVNMLHEETMNLDSTTFKSYTKSFTLPERNGTVIIYLIVEKGSAYFDNAKLFKK